MIVDIFFPNDIFIQDSRQRVIKIEIVNRGTFYLWNERAPCVPWSLINSRTFKIQDIFSPAIDFARSYNAGALTNDPQIPYSHRRYRRGIRGNSVSVESAGLHAGIGELVIWEGEEDSSLKIWPTIDRERSPPAVETRSMVADNKLDVRLAPIQHFMQVANEGWKRNP